MKKLIFAIFLLISTLHVFSENNITETFALNFATVWHFAPQEKVYIHTDKPYYSAGETLWFAAYLTNAATHLSNTKSRYIYVELLDIGDSAIARIKVRADSVCFSGHIPLPPEMSAGIYNLHAYTYWMQNAPAEFFFAKKIFIGNDIDDRINCRSDFGTLGNGELPLTLTFTNAFNAPVTQRKITVAESWGKNAGRSYQIDNTGKVRIALKINEISTDKKYVHINIKEEGINFNKKILLPELKQDFDLQFMPESGVFLDNHIQNLAFKATGTNGFGIEVNGKIFDRNDREITALKTAHKGMGRVAFKTSPGETYYAEVETAEGTVKRFDLPQTQTSGIALHLLYNRGRIFFQTMRAGSLPDSLLLMIHSRGIVLSVIPLTQTEGSLSEDLLPAGINSFSIVDPQGNIYCERLYFSRNFKFPDVTMTADKKYYGKREPVSLDFQILDSENKPVEGHFSLSVTDSKNIVADTLNTNIINYLLLTSDLQGYVEEPNLYFIDNSNSTREKTDILLLTQGWRRFDTESVLKKKYTENKFYIEAGQAVSGKVLNLFNKPAKKHQVILFSKYKNRIAVAETDDEGRFLFEGIEFPDSTEIVIKAKSKAKIVDVEVICDKDIFPNPEINIPFREQIKIEPPKDYFQIIKEKYYTEGGIMLVNLDEITIRAKKQRDAQEEFYASTADNVITAERIENMGGLTVLDLLATIAGIQVMGQEVSIRGGGKPLFVIDGIYTDNIDDVYYLNTSDIEAIYVYKGVSASIFGSQGANGAIAITLKRGALYARSQPPSLLHIMPLGFQKPDTFYVPRYDVDSIYRLPASDLRTTVYWNPQIMTDAAGKASVKFYTADKANDYDIILEGIGKKGEICRYRAKIKRFN